MTLIPIKRHSGFAHVNPWTPEETSFLLAEYRNKSDLPRIAAHVRRTENGVYRKLYAMGVIDHGGARHEIKKAKVTRIGVVGVPTYSCPELRPFDGRPGSMDAFACPSRVGSRLHYRDGRVVEI